MINAQTGQPDLLAKVVLVGAPGAGKAAMVKAMAGKYSHSSVRAGEIGEGKVFRTEFFWPQALADGTRLRIRLFGISGEPVYQAVGQLVMADADALVFVANLARERATAAQEALQSMVLNARQNALNLSTLPAALHYQLPGPGDQRNPPLEPVEMDQWLGIPSGSLPCFVGSLEKEASMCAAVEWVVSRLASQVPAPPEPRDSPVIRRRVRRERRDSIATP